MDVDRAQGGPEMFSERLRKLRQSKGLSRKELGQALGLAESTISNYENDLRTPDYELLTRIADFFEVSTDYLLGRTDDPKGHVSGDYSVSLEELMFLRWIREHVKGVFFAEFDEAPEESKQAVMETLRWYWETIEKPRIMKEKNPS